MTSGEKIRMLMVEVVHVVLGGLDVPECSRWFYAPLTQMEDARTFLVMPMNIMDMLDDPAIVSNGMPHVDAVAQLIVDFPGATFVYSGGDTVMVDGMTHWQRAVERSKVFAAEEQGEE